MDDDVMGGATSYRSGEEADRASANRDPADVTGKIRGQRADRYTQLPDPGAARVRDYRLYCLSGDGHIGFADWIEAASDEEAISKARALRPDAHKCEVWHKTRLVARINSDGVSNAKRPIGRT